MLDLHKKVIISFLEKRLSKKEKELQNVNNWNKSINKILEFISRGKNIRGSLVLQSYLSFKDNISEDSVKVASAVELIHSSLLIHDDIMDSDKFRRGDKTISAKFTEFAKEEEIKNPDHFGESMGISIGDLGFFLGFELLSEVKNSNDSVIRFISQELSKVTLAQMQDVYGGLSEKEFSEEEILSVYKYKTGRYSISMPLVLGAMLAEKDEQTLKILEDLGEKMGILFQIKDDEIGIFGEEQEIGKPVGSDIKENKKTIFRFYLYKLAKHELKEKLNTIFGNKEIQNSQVEFVKDLIKVLGVSKKVNELIKKLENEIKENTIQLNLPENHGRAFLEFLDYNLKRKK